MNTQTRLVHALFLTLGLGLTGLFAQEQMPETGAPPPPPPGGGGMMGMGMGAMRNGPKLDLTDEQKAKFADLRQTLVDQMKALRDDESLTPQQKRAKMGEIMKTAETGYRALLTPEQQEKYDEFKKEYPMMGMGKRPGRGGRPDLQALLDLTDDQKSKSAEIREDTMAEMKAIREDSTLSTEEKRSKMMEVQKSGTEKFKAILTPDQLEKFTDSMKRMGGRPPGEQGAPDGPPPPENGTESNSGGNGAPAGGVM